MANPIFDFSHLTHGQRIRLAQDLWDSLEPDETADMPLTDEMQAELKRRVEVALRHPKAGSSWADVEARVRDAIDRVRYPLTEARKAELNRRLEEHDRNPHEGVTWEALREELMRDLQRDGHRTKDTD